MYITKFATSGGWFAGKKKQTLLKQTIAAGEKS